MKAQRWIALASVAVGFSFLTASASAAEPKKKGDQIREGAYYEFRGHVSDRNTLENTFTLIWEKGSQLIRITTNTVLYRRGRPAKLEEVKAGDAARGVGQAIKGKLVATAVAFGEEGVELPPNVRVPESITLPPPTRE